jgi:ADP-ribose pyrophosphatase
MPGWRKLDERLTFAGRYRRVLTRRFGRPDGSVGDYEVKLEDAVVAMVALTEDGDVLLVRQFRVGPEAELLELPGGIVEDGQGALETARRELLEETGHDGELEHVADIVDCGYSTRLKHAFVARGCRPVAEPAPHDGEFLEVVRLSLPEFREHLRSGRLTDVDVGYLGLDRLGLL